MASLHVTEGNVETNVKGFKASGPTNGASQKFTFPHQGMDPFGPFSFQDGIIMQQKTPINLKNRKFTHLNGKHVSFNQIIKSSPLYIYKKIEIYTFISIFI